MTIGSAIGAGASALGGIFSGGAARQASAQQQQMGMLGLMAQMQANQQAQQNLAPFMNIGSGAFGKLGAMYGLGAPSSGGSWGPPGTLLGSVGSSPLAAAASPGGNNYADFYNSPDYGFALQQGGQAVDRSAAARGLIQSGGLLKELQNFGQGLASQQFGNYFNRLLSMSQIGANAATGSASNALASGNAMASSLGNIGQAGASGTVGGANALSGALGNLGMYGMMGFGGGNRSMSSYGGGFPGYSQPEMAPMWS